MMLAIAMLSTQACTLIGAGIGSQTPKRETVSDPRRIAPGAEVDVEYCASGGSASAGVSSAGMPIDEDAGPERGHVRGKFVRIADGALVVVDASGIERGVSLGEVREIRVKTEGSHWATGALAGGAIDVVLVVLAVSIFHGPHFTKDESTQGGWF